MEADKHEVDVMNDLLKFPHFVTLHDNDLNVIRCR